MSSQHISTMKFSIPDGKTVLGIDQSLTCSGIAVISGNQLMTEVIIPPKTEIVPVKRLVYIREQVKKLVALHKPAIAAIEGYAFGASASRAHSLGELGGLLRVLLYESSVPVVYVIPPTVLKKFATGKGNSDKGSVSKGLYKKWCVDVENNNEVDAAGLALIGASLHFPTEMGLEKSDTVAISKAVETLPVGN